MTKRHWGKCKYESGVMCETPCRADEKVAALEAENARLNLRVDALSREVMDCPNCEKNHQEVERLRGRRAGMHNRIGFDAGYNLWAIVCFNESLNSYFLMCASNIYDDIIPVIRGRCVYATRQAARLARQRMGNHVVGARIVKVNVLVEETA